MNFGLAIKVLGCEVFSVGTEWHRDDEDADDNDVIDDDEGESYPFITRLSLN